MVDALLNQLLIIHSQRADLDVNVPHVEYLSRRDLLPRWLPLVGMVTNRILRRHLTRRKVDERVQLIEVYLLFRLRHWLLEITLHERWDIGLWYVVNSVKLLPGRSLVVVQSVFHLLLELLAALEDLQEVLAALVIFVDIDLLPRAKVFLCLLRGQIRIICFVARFVADWPLVVLVHCHWSFVEPPTIVVLCTCRLVD